MKKFLLVLMAILMIFTLIACGDDEETSSSDSGVTTGSSNAPSSGDELQKPGVDDDDTTASSKPKEDDDDDENQGGLEDPTGLVLTNALIKQIEESAAFKLGISLSVTLENNNWYMYDSAVNERTYFEGVADFTVFVSNSENGYDLKVFADVKSRDTDDGKYQTDVKRTIYYIVDGAIYNYNESLDAYIVSESTQIDTTELEEMIGALVGEVNLTEEQTNEILNSIGNALIEGLAISNNKGHAFVDNKVKLDVYLNYLRELDPEKTSLRNLINAFLTISGYEGTIEDSLASAEEFYKMTLSQVIDAIEEMITAQCGITIQELYAGVLSNEAIRGLISNYLLSSYPEMTEEEIEEYINSLAEESIIGMIPEEMMEMTVYDIILAMVMSGDGSLEDGTEPLVSQIDTPPTLEEVMEHVNNLLDKNLTEIQIGEDFFLADIVELAKNIDIHELNSRLDIEFTGMFILKSLSYEENVSITIKTDSEVSGKKNKNTVSTSIGVSLMELSKNEYVINAPKDKALVEDIFGKDFYSDDLTLYLEMMIDEDGTYGEGAILLFVYDYSFEDEMEYAEPSTFAVITLDNISGEKIIISHNEIHMYNGGVNEIPLGISIILYPEYEMFEMEVIECDHLWGAWETDYESGMVYRECSECGAIQYQEVEEGYTITYYGVEDAYNPNPDVYTDGDDIIFLEDAEREGYVFLGWFYDAELTEEAVYIDPSITLGDIEFYAKWEEATEPPEPDDEPDENTDWSGETLNILATVWGASQQPGAPWSQVELVISHGNYSTIGFGNIINSAVVDREAYIMDKYGVSLNWINSRGMQVKQLLEEATLSGSEVYHIAMPRMMEAQNLVQSERMLLHDLSSSGFINLDASYYSQVAREAYTINGVTLFAAGDFSFLDEQTADVLFYNEAMADGVENFPDVYQLVREGKWTIDEMTNVAKLVSDNRGSSQWTDDDVYGFGTGNLARFYQYSGIQQVSVVNNEYVITLNDDNVDELIEKILEISKASWARTSWDGGFSAMGNAFSGGSLLFYNEVVQKLDTFKGSSGTFKPAVLPVPKLNENQEGYSTPCSYMSVLMCIPTTTDNKAMSEFFFEVLSSTGEEYIMSAYYQNLLSKLYYKSASKSREMLEDYIFPNVIYDVGYMHSWSGLLTSVQSDSYSDGRNNFDSVYAFELSDAVTTVSEWNSAWGRYESQTVTITYYPGTGYFEDDNAYEKKISKNSRYAAHPTPLHDDPSYEFNGWYLDPEFQTKVNNSYRYSEDTTLYASWKSIQSCTSGGEHSFTAWSTKDEATCTTKGTSSRTCLSCGYIDVVISVQPLGHNWGAWNESFMKSQRECMRCQEKQVKEYENITKKAFSDFTIEGEYFGVGNEEFLFDGVWDQPSNQAISPKGKNPFYIILLMNENSIMDRVYVKGKGAGSTFDVYVKYVGKDGWEYLGGNDILTSTENESDSREIPYFEVDNEKTVEAVVIAMENPSVGNDYFEEIAIVRASE